MAASAGDDISRVELDALVVLQIMKHCQQQAPRAVTGQLLGLDVENVQQITHSFGYLQKSTDENARAQSTQDDGDQYQMDMMRSLRQVNVDANTIGWYQTAHLGAFFNETVIDTQYYYQEQIPNSVLLVYDQLQSRIGKPSFKALRLTKAFMERYKNGRDNNTNTLREFPSGSMFVEIPIAMTSPAIVEAFLVDWAISDPLCTTQIDSLDVEDSMFLDKNVQLLINSLQDLAEEQNKMQMFERNAARQDDKGKGKGKYNRQGPKPKPLDTMILSQQIQNYCKQINSSAGDAFGKVFLVSNKPGGIERTP